ncbi:MAG: ATP-binding protein [Candidatus Paceibacterota bacterium]|jgi:hypothetical protein
MEDTKEPVSSSAPVTPPVVRAEFLDLLSRAYTNRRKGVVILTGDVHGSHQTSDGQFSPLTVVLDKELSKGFNVVFLSSASGIEPADPDTFYEEIGIAGRVARAGDDEDSSESASPLVKPQKSALPKRSFAESIRSKIAESSMSTLANLRILKFIAETINKARTIISKMDASARPKCPRPICIVVTYAGSLFPEGEFDRLSELDRQRLVYFLEWVSDPRFADDPHLVTLISKTRSEVNSKVLYLPVSVNVEIPLPSRAIRKAFVENFLAKNAGFEIASGYDVERFIDDTAGMNVPDLRDMLVFSKSSGEPVSRTDVLNSVCAIIQQQLGDAVRVCRPAHSVDDVVGYETTKKLLSKVFARCDRPETAVAGILVSGPNGAGKTYVLEAFSAKSGRVVIELVGLRDKWFGGTEKLFELLRLYLTTLGNVAIFVDEAHTAFGSVHGGNVHETEKRLSGNMIKMMGDPRNLGKIIWILMTSRPDCLDPDVKSRSPIQIPIFDLEGSDRALFVAEVFSRKGVVLSDVDKRALAEKTSYYSSRDYRFLVAELLAWRSDEPNIDVAGVLERWNASNSIGRQRRLQELIALQHCSYPQLVPDRLRRLSEDGDKLEQEIERLRVELRMN